MSSEWLRHHPFMLAMSFIAPILAAAIMPLFFRPQIRKRIGRWQWPLIVLTYFVTRIVLWYIVFIATDARPNFNDWRFFHWNAHEILQGKLILGLSPLNHIFEISACLVWDNPASTILAFILVDALCLCLLCKLARISVGERSAPEVAWLWAINPAAWIITVRYGQDETPVCFFLLLCAYLYMRQSKWWQPILLSLGVLSSKITIAAGMFVIWTYSRFKMRDAAVALVTLLVVFVPLIALRADFLITWRNLKDPLCGISIPTVIDRMVTLGVYTRMMHDIGSILAVALVLLVCFICHKRNLPLLECLTACLIAFLLFAPVAIKIYRLWYLGPLGLHALRTRQIGRYAIYTGLLSVFDDFSFNTYTKPAAVMYCNGVLGIAILCMEIAYLFQMLNVKVTKTVPEQERGAISEVSIV